MPTYEYVCQKCGHQFDKVQSMTEKPLAVCPQESCAQKRWGKGKVRRAISGGAGLIFKGSGFYITDYRSDNYKQGAKKESSAATAPASSSGGDKGSSGNGSSATKSEAAKPAAKPKGE